MVACTVSYSVLVDGLELDGAALQISGLTGQQVVSQFGEVVEGAQFGELKCAEAIVRGLCVSDQFLLPDTHLLASGFALSLDARRSAQQTLEQVEHGLSHQLSDPFTGRRSRAMTGSAK